MKFIYSVGIFFLIFLTSCNGNQSPQKTSEEAPKIVSDSLKTEPKITSNEKKSEEKQTSTEPEQEKLTTENAIPFFYEYAKKHKENRVRIITELGNIEIELFEKTPYHRANFIFLARQGYFNGSCFHRVVKDFIIQGGNSDTWEIAKKRQKIGHYLLPPDTKKGIKHHRGVISMPSSEIDNPHQFASPYEFFIVCQKPGAYHLDGKYTAFGRVISGMEVVDAISEYATDNREWPIQNVLMKVEVVE